MFYNVLRWLRHSSPVILAVSLTLAPVPGECRGHGSHSGLQWCAQVGFPPLTDQSWPPHAHLSLRPVPWHHVPGRSNLTLGHCTVDMIHCSYYQSLLITTIYIVLWRNVGYFSVTCSNILPWSNMLQWLDCFVSVFGACFNFQNKCLNLGTRHLIIWETF